MLELGAARLDLADLGQLLGVLDEDRSRVRVLQDVLALLGRVGLVDRDERPARREDAEAGVAPLGAGVREDRDLVPGLEAEVDQPEGDLLRDLAELRVGDVLPLVADLVAKGRRVAVALRGQGQKISDGLRPGATTDSSGALAP